MIDKIDAKIISKLCTEYRTQYELLLSTQSGEESIIKSAWENEKEEFYSGNFRRFKIFSEQWSRNCKLWNLFRFLPFKRRTSGWFSHKYV